MGGYPVYIDEPLKKYLDETASGSPTPGGGSVAALAGALGAALTSMVCNFTVGKKKYRDVEAEVNQMLLESEEIRDKLQELVVKDTRAYGKVSAAYSMPKATSEEKEIRSKAIQNALIEAMQAPLEIAICCYEILKLNEPLLEKGNQNLISDVGVAVLLAEAAMRSAVLNVEINLSYIKDEELCREAREKLQTPLSEASDIKNEVYKKVKEIIGAKLT
jgi:glutamate formiminotransferase/formiminotetrahydrofolate cyclodeaminase